MAGVTGYSGDLAKSSFVFTTMGPNIGVNIKYRFPNDYILLRAGIMYGTIKADDKNNSDVTVSERNLNFKSAITEGNLILEVNILDPYEYIGLPYLFAGVGLFHFNPYTTDNSGQKTYLQPLLYHTLYLPLIKYNH